MKKPAIRGVQTKNNHQAGLSETFERILRRYKSIYKRDCTQPQLKASASIVVHNTKPLDERIKYNKQRFKKSRAITPAARSEATSVGSVAVGAGA